MESDTDLKMQYPFYFLLMKGDLLKQRNKKKPGIASLVKYNLIKEGGKYLACF